MSNTRLLNSIASPSEIVRRIERSFRPISKSSYSQSSAFHTLICWCCSGGVLSGIIQLLLDALVVLSHARGALGVQENLVVDTNRAARGVNLHSISPDDLVHPERAPGLVRQELRVVKHIRAPHVARLHQLEPVCRGPRVQVV